MRGFFVFLIMLCALTFPVYAAGIIDSAAVEKALPSSARELMEGISAESADAEGILQRFGDYIKKHVSSELRAVMRPVGICIGAAVLCSLGEGLQNKDGMNYVNFAACLVIAAAALGDVNSVATMGRSAVTEMHEFSKVLLPTMCSAAAAAGAISSSAAAYAASALFMDVLLSAAESLLLPTVGAYTALLLASSALGDGRLKAAVKLLKWVCTRSLCALAALFSFVLGFTGLASGGVDAAAAKTAKAVLSSFVPVVGKVVAGASETLVAGMGLVRGAVGIFGLGAVLAVCAAPFLAMGLRYIMFKVAAAVAALVAGDRLASLIEGIGSVYGMIMGLVGTGAALMFVSVLSFIKAVG